MPRRVQVFESPQLTTAAQICRESIRILHLHPSHFHSISVLFFSPQPVSLFIAHLLARQFPWIPPSAAIESMLEENGAPLILLKVISNSIFASIMCFPSSITFTLLGRAATARSVMRSYNGRTSLSGRRWLVTSGGIWCRLLLTCFWEFFIILGLFFAMVMSLVAVPRILNGWGICSSVVGFWAALVFLGVPFCVAFAHVLVIGNLARVLTVLEEDNCCGLKTLVKAKGLVKERRQTALIMALWSNLGLRLVEGLFEFRLSRGMRMWEGSILVSMYSFVIVFDTVMHVVFYCTCKP